MNFLNLQQLFLIIFFLLMLEGFFSGSEIALLSADKLTLKQKIKKSDRRLFKNTKLALELSNHPERILSTTLLVTCFCVAAISCVLSLFFLSQDTPNSEIWTTITASPLIILFGEIFPKILFRKHATSVAPWVATPIYASYFLLYPITKILSLYTSRLARFVGPIQDLMLGRKRKTREDLKALLSYNKSETDIKSSEKKMIRRIFDFKDTEAKNALIPLVQVQAIERSSTVLGALKQFGKNQHSRMPVYAARIDNIIGILDATSLFAADDLQQSIQHFITSAKYIPETQSLEDLLVDVRNESTEMLVVVDEHGGAVGILTFEDIAEEIVGEISDEYDTLEIPYKELSENKWLIYAHMEIEGINDRLGLDLPGGDYETLSGFLLQQFGRIPNPKDELFFNTSGGNFKFIIRTASERRIESVIIEKL